MVCGRLDELDEHAAAQLIREQNIDILIDLHGLSSGARPGLFAQRPAPLQGAPYSQAIRSGPFLFISGQIPLDPKTGNIVPGGVAEQTRQVLANLRAVLKEAGSDLDKAVKTTVFLKNMNDFGAMNEVYGKPEYFGPNPPARSTVEVARLPRDVLVEIELVALAS